MTLTVGAIVEGHGEVAAVPILIRRAMAEVAPEIVVRVVTQRVARSRLVRLGELERAVTLAASKVGDRGIVLVLIDADDDLACELAPRLQARALSARNDRVLSTVLAVREYEAWFLAAAISLRGVRGLRRDLEPPDEPEAIRDAKGWLDARMVAGRAYAPAVDQAALTAAFDLAAARSTRSFAKFWREVERWARSSRAGGDL